MIKSKTCEECEEKAATVFCPERQKCYCDECNKCVHAKPKKKRYKAEEESEKINADARCPLHKDDQSGVYRVGEVKLSCALCKLKEANGNHNVVDISEICQDNEMLSTVEARKRFTDALGRNYELENKIEEAIESIRREREASKEKIKKTFMEAWNKLNEEELRVMEELDRACIEGEEVLQTHLFALKEVHEHSELLCEADPKGKESSSRLITQDLVREMEKQRKIMEELQRTELMDLKIGWDAKERKLSFSRTLFNGKPILNNIMVKSVTSDSITLTWDLADEGVSYYQIEVDGGKERDVSRTNSFTKRGLLPGTEHSFRVRTVKWYLASAWSDVVRGRTEKDCTNFSGHMWKGCPADAEGKRRYSVDEENPRIATKINGNEWCTIIGNTPLPLDKATTLNVKILASKNKGDGIYIGVAPFDIDQNDFIHNRQEWYFDCYGSKLWSGPPHNYRGKEYGPRKEYGEYVHTEDTVGTIMDTKRGEISFILNGVNLGVAYEGIPLDKPLVPCVLLKYEGDSVELY